MKTKFKVGDRVVTKDDLSLSTRIDNIFKKEVFTGLGFTGYSSIPRITCSNGKTYNEGDLLPYDYVTALLDIRIKSLVQTNDQFTKQLQSMFDSKLSGVYKRLERLENFMANQALNEVKSKKIKKCKK